MAGVPLPEEEETWARKPYTRKELDALCLITPDMELQEIYRRIKATTYDKPWAFTEIKGIRFSLDQKSLQEPNSKVEKEHFRQRET